MFAQIPVVDHQFQQSNCHILGVLDTVYRLQLGIANPQTRGFRTFVVVDTRDVADLSCFQITLGAKSIPLAKKNIWCGETPSSVG